MPLVGASPLEKAGQHVLLDALLDAEVDVIAAGGKTGSQGYGVFRGHHLAPKVVLPAHDELVQPELLLCSVLLDPKLLPQEAV